MDTIHDDVREDIDTFIEPLVSGKREKKSSLLKKLLTHMQQLGFTNRLCCYTILILCFEVSASFILAWRSQSLGYSGALAVWTCNTTVLSGMVSVVLSKAVTKSQAENTEGGIKFESAKAANFGQSSAGYSEYDDDWESPAI